MDDADDVVVGAVLADPARLIVEVALEGAALDRVDLRVGQDDDREDGAPRCGVSLWSSVDRGFAESGASDVRRQAPDRCVPASSLVPARSILHHLRDPGVPDYADAHPLGCRLVLPRIFRHQRCDARHDDRCRMGLPQAPGVHALEEVAGHRGNRRLGGGMLSRALHLDERIDDVIERAFQTEHSLREG